MAIDNGTYSPSGVLCGVFTRLQPSSTGAASVSTVAKEDFAGKYTLSQRTLSQREQAMVPHLADWYIIPKEVVRVCEHAKATTSTAQPMRNFLFRGNAGTGKTMGAQAIAAGLNLPYTLMTCSANTEISDLVGQFIPDTRGFGPGDPDGSGELPKISDIVMHPPSVYKELTGEYDEEKTEDDVLQKLVEIAVGRLACQEESQGQRIRYVDTPLLDAIRHGYVCEIQEPSCIANPGVLVGLNSLLDNCQTITLPTGERVRRHPDTVIIVTTNSDYEGCRSINQSVISRMDLIFDMDAPDISTMVQRVMKITGFSDETVAAKMALVVRDIADRCRQTMITDGSCGMREYKSWILSTLVTGDPYESALTTVIASASADADNRAELISTCLDPQFTQKF
jgi:MoxR-like ATPase